MKKKQMMIVAAAEAAEFILFDGTGKVKSTVNLLVKGNYCFLMFLLLYDQRAIFFSMNSTI